MGRLEDLRIVDPVLTQLSRGYSNNQLIGSEVLPFVPVTKEGGKIPLFGKEAFKMHDNSKRAIGADPARILPESRSTATFSPDEYALEYPIDRRETQEADFDLEAYATNVVTEKIRLTHEKLVADMLQNLATYPEGNKTTLTITAKWSDYTSGVSDPVKDVNAGKEVVRGKIGKRPNVMVVGAKTLPILQEHPKLIGKIQYSMKGVLTIDLLKEIFNVEKFLIGESIYSTDAGTFVDLWQDNCMLFYIPSIRSMYEPSFGYTFRKEGFPIVSKYIPDNGLSTVIQARDLFVPKVIAAEGGYIIEDTN